jgi:hypothetical protein
VVGATGFEPVSSGVRVTVEEPRRGLTLGDQPVQDGHDGVGVDPALDSDGEGFAGVVDHDVEQRTSR